MSDDKTIAILTPLPAVVLDADDGHVHKTGETLPHTGLEKEVSNAELLRQLKDLRTVIIDSQQATIDAIKAQVGGLMNRVDEHHVEIGGHADAIADHEVRLVGLDKRVTSLEGSPTDTPQPHRRSLMPSPYLRIAAGALVWLALATLIVVGILRVVV